MIIYCKRPSFAHPHARLIISSGFSHDVLMNKTPFQSSFGPQAVEYSAWARMRLLYQLSRIYGCACANWRYKHEYICQMASFVWPILFVCNCAFSISSLETNDVTLTANSHLFAVFLQLYHTISLVTLDTACIRLSKQYFTLLKMY
jgi:hypothetical protein